MNEMKKNKDIMKNVKQVAIIAQVGKHENTSEESTMLISFSN